MNQVGVFSLQKSDSYTVTMTDVGVIFNICLITQINKNPHWHCGMHIQIISSDPLGFAFTHPLHDCDKHSCLPASVLYQKARLTLFETAVTVLEAVSATVSWPCAASSDRQNLGQDRFNGFALVQHGKRSEQTAFS